MCFIAWGGHIAVHFRLLSLFRCPMVATACVLGSIRETPSKEILLNPTSESLTRDLIDRVFSPNIPLLLLEGPGDLVTRL